MHPKDADRMANSADPDLTAPGAVWSVSTLFAQTCLSEKFGTLRYFFMDVSGWHEIMLTESEISSEM